MSYKLAISNIAWPNESDDQVANSLQKFGFEGLEVALTKIWPDPLSISDDDLFAYKEWWMQKGINIVAAQALLFGKPKMTLFESPEQRKLTLNYLKKITRAASLLGVKRLVFGSPKNRKLLGSSLDTAMDIAVDFFSELAKYAHSLDTKIVIEANPQQYGGDFITRSEQAIDLVQKVNHPGFALHLCSGCMSLGGDSASEMVEKGHALLKHVHISEPYLNPVTNAESEHHSFASSLKKVGYDGWCSIEMRQEDNFTIEGFERNLEFIANLYA